MSLTPFHHHPGHGNAIFDPFAMDSTWDPFMVDYNRHIPSAPRLSSSSDMMTSSLVNACIDWKETPDAHIFKADLPGIKKEEVKVELEEDRVLQISGERSREVEENSDRWHRVERSSGRFVRKFRLPENVKMDQIKACMEHGVLTVTVPKEQKKRDVKAIQISN